MFNFFSFKKKQKEQDNLNSLIVTRLDRIIELLEQEQQQQQKEGSIKNFHFDHVQIDHLENIIFRLDNIEIDELSGKLVIGNNIRSTEELAKSLVLKADKGKAKKEVMSDSSPLHQEQMEQTPKGFRFRKD